MKSFSSLSRRLLTGRTKVVCCVRTNGAERAPNVLWSCWHHTLWAGLVVVGLEQLGRATTVPGPDYCFG
jgi:hypothetical protein